MTRDELFGLLDLKPDTSDDGDPIEAGPDEDSRPQAPPSPTALALDAWGRRRGAELARESEFLNQTPKAGTTGGVGGLKVDGDEAADLFGASFEPDPKLAYNPADKIRSEFMAQLMETAEFRELHSQTMLDDNASEVACAHFATGYVAFRAERASQQAQGQPAGPHDALKHVAGGLKGAQGAVEQYKDAMNGLGCGAGPGQPGGTLDAKRLAGVFKRVRKSKVLTSIMAKVGRFCRVAQSRQRLKADHGLDDAVGVKLAGDLAALLPSELARLGHPLLKLDALRRLVEQQSQCREWRSVEPEGRGPIMVVVDESGSMSGQPVETAKALALAMVLIARRQRRWVGLVAFSGGTTGRYLTLQPGQTDEGPLLDWLEQFLGGGTCLDVPLVEMPQLWAKMGAPKGKTDVLMITDAEVNCGDEMAANFNSWRKHAKARVVTMLVGCRDVGDLAKVSDEVHRVGVIDAGSEEVASVLSI